MGIANKITETERNRIVEMYRNNYPVSLIAKELNRNHSTVERLLKREGIFVSSNIHYPKELDQLIIDDYFSGMMIKDVASKYGISEYTVLKRIKNCDGYTPKHRWTEDEIEILRKYYPLRDFDTILKLIPNTTKMSIIVKASQYKIRCESFFWSESDIEILLKGYANNIPVSEIYQKLNEKFSYDAIKTKAGKLGLTSRDVVWTDEENTILKTYYPLMTVDEICKLIPLHTRKSIVMQACTLKVKNLLSIEKPIKVKKLGDYLRANNSKWFNDSQEKCNNKCIITGDTKYDIHHIVSFNTIANEALIELNLSDRESLDEFTVEEKHLILESFLKHQSCYPLGICICNDIHKHFHRLYGYGNNTEDQWNEFINTYYS